MEEETAQGQVEGPNRSQGWAFFLLQKPEHPGLKAGVFSEMWGQGDREWESHW